MYGVSTAWSKLGSPALNPQEMTDFLLLSHDQYPTAASDAEDRLLWLHRSSASKPARLATPASLVRRRQRELSSRRAHALRARRAGDSGSSDAAGGSSRRQRGRRRVRPSAAPGLNDAKAGSSGVDFARKQEPKSRYLSREEEIDVCRAIQVCTCALVASTDLLKAPTAVREPTAKLVPAKPAPCLVKHRFEVIGTLQCYFACSQKFLLAAVCGECGVCKRV